ncbi:hypothetical protein HJC23_011783 [Cyclotella cryptica]|uniref:Uncharacterized protein n=1 Tax=Cyclotella cryptica TaxID=29204 RepID=A0ABD3PMN9_9STRA
MPRFTDNWVLEKIMFIYLEGGSACFCCTPVPTSLFSPEKDPVESMIRSMSDLHPDEVECEIRALATSPWDEEMKDQVWGDRGMLRFRMKREMGGYRRFLEGVAVESREEDGETMHLEVPAVSVLSDFCKNHISPSELYELFQVSREDLVDVLKTKYKICSFYTVVFCTVAEQLENFDVTGCGDDAPSCSDDGNNHDTDNRDNSELGFEKDLKFDNTGRGFCIDVVNNLAKSVDGNDNQCTINDPVLLRFLQRMVSLSGPTLLARASSAGGCRGSSHNFRSDRRVIRLIIARLWADRLIDKYTEFKSKVSNELN